MGKLISDWSVDQFGDELTRAFEEFHPENHRIGERVASAAKRESADPDALRLEDDDGARFEFFSDCVEVREQKRRLLLGRRSVLRRNRTTEGRSALRVARRVAKSVSAETRIRFSAAARSKISSSAAD